MLAHFGGDVSKATDFVQLRRKQPRGTSTNRNDGEETFLVFSDEERIFTSTSIDSCIHYMAMCAQIHLILLNHFT